MRRPAVYKTTTIKKWDCDAEVEDGRWIPARPVGYDAVSLWWRLKVAWRTFIGKYDALDWED